MIALSDRIRAAYVRWLIRGNDEWLRACSDGCLDPRQERAIVLQSQELRVKLAEIERRTRPIVPSWKRGRSALSPLINVATILIAFALGSMRELQGFILPLLVLLSVACGMAIGFYLRP